MTTDNAYDFAYWIDNIYAYGGTLAGRSSGNFVTACEVKVVLDENAIS